MDRSLEIKRNRRTKAVSRLCSTPVFDRNFQIPSCSSISDVKSGSSSGKANLQTDSASTFEERKKKKKKKKGKRERNALKNISKRKRKTTSLLHQTEKLRGNAVRMDSDWETMEESISEKPLSAQKPLHELNLFESPEKIRDAGRSEISLVSSPLLLQREFVFSPEARSSNNEGNINRKRRAFTLAISSSSSSLNESPIKHETVDSPSPVCTKLNVGRTYSMKKPPRKVEGRKPPKDFDLRSMKFPETTLSDLLWEKFVQKNITEIEEYRRCHAKENLPHNQIEERGMDSSSSSNDFINGNDLLWSHNKKALYRKGMTVVRGNIKRRSTNKEEEGESLEGKKVTEDPYDFSQYVEDDSITLPEVTFNRYNTIMKNQTRKVNNEEKGNDEYEKREANDEIDSNSESEEQENEEKKVMRVNSTFEKLSDSSETADEEVSSKTSFCKKRDASTGKRQKSTKSIEVHDKVNSRKSRRTSSKMSYLSNIQRSKPRILSIETVKGFRLVR